MATLPHSGSWFGLPDFGITEKISDTLGLPRTSSGGSSLIGVTDRERQLAQSGGQSVLGLSSDSYPKSSYATQSYETSTAPRTTSTTGGTPTSTAPTGQSFEDQARNAGFNTVDEWQNWQRQRQETKNTITSGFDNIRSRLDEMAGMIPGQQQEDEGLLGQQVSGIATQLSGARDNSLERLGGFRDTVKRRAMESTEDVAGNLRQLLMASRRQLGVLGASDSSASEIGLPYALGKQAARAGGEIARGQNDQLSQLDQKEIDVRDTFETATAEVEQFRISALQQIRDKGRAAIERINQLRLQADESELQALSSLETQILSVVSQQLIAAEEEARQNRQGIQQWAMNRMSQLNDFKLQLGQNANFSPQDIVYSELQGLGGLRGGGTNGLVNLGVRRRDEEQA